MLELSVDGKANRVRRQGRSDMRVGPTVGRLPSLSISHEAEEAIGIGGVSLHSERILIDARATHLRVRLHLNHRLTSRGSIPSVDAKDALEFLGVGRPLTKPLPDDERSVHQAEPHL